MRYRAVAFLVFVLSQYHTFYIKENVGISCKRGNVGVNVCLGMKRDDGGEWTEEDAHCFNDTMGRTEPERASIHTPISQQNVGFKLLQKMGWKEGAGLGRNEDGGLQRMKKLPIRGIDHLG